MWSDDVKRKRRSVKENRKSFYTVFSLSFLFAHLSVADFAGRCSLPVLFGVREEARRCGRERLKTGVIAKYILFTTWNMKTTRNLFGDTMPHRVLLMRLPSTI